MIELKNTVKKFDSYTALNGVDLKIEKGTAFGLLGSNGAGKSTILRLLSGIYKQEGGNEYSVFSVHKQETITLLNNYYRPYQTAMTPYDTSIVELVLDHKYDVYDDTGMNFEELEEATEPLRDPSKKPSWKVD